MARIIAGAVCGGLSESFSMLLGFRYLMLVAAGFYLLSAALLASRSGARTVTAGLPRIAGTICSALLVAAVGIG